MRTVRFTWRVLVQQLSLLPADGEVEGFGCIRERVDNVLYSFLRVGEKGEVIDIVLHVTHTTHTHTHTNVYTHTHKTHAHKTHAHTHTHTQHTHRLKTRWTHSLATSLSSPQEKQWPNCESANSCSPPQAATLK